MAKKEFSVEAFTAFIEEVEEKKALNKTKLTIDFMDAFVGMMHPEDIDTWVEKCLSFPAITRKIGGKEREMKDDVSVRAYFIATYFPNYTEAALEAAKAAAKAAKDAAKAEKEMFDKMTPAEQFRYKMEKFAKKN